jgi:hypothetical protein
VVRILKKAPAQIIYATNFAEVKAMMDNDFTRSTAPLGLAESWGMFALTGNPAYYLLYKSLLEDRDELAEEYRLRR